MSDAPEPSVPVLSRQDLAEDLKRLYESPRDHHLFAYFGTGADDVVDLANASRVTIVPVRSELDLRMQLPRFGDEDRVAFLVPFTGGIPLDLQARFAMKGTIRRIRDDARLRRLFGVKETADDVASSALARYLLEQTETPAMEVGVPRITLARMWGAYFRAEWGAPWAGDPTASAMLGWAVRDGRGPRFASTMSQGTAALVRREWLEYLDARVPHLGRLVWEAWERDEAELLLTLGLVLEPFAETLAEAAVESEGDGSPTGAEVTWARMTMKSDLGVDDPATGWHVAAALARATGGALRTAMAGGSEERATWRRNLLEAADERAGDPELAAGIGASRRLRRAWQMRLGALGEALSEAAAAARNALKEPGPAGMYGARLPAKHVDAVSDALGALREHETYRVARLTTVRRGEMAARLVAWLAARPELDRLGGMTPYADAEALARWYADEGGYVDQARRYARNVWQDPLGIGAQAVVEAADAARDTLDRAFAQGLAGWMEAGKPSKQMVPIEHALERVAARFLDADDEHRLLVLMMDGMAWAQAVELLESMGEQLGNPWGPLAWHRMKSGRIGDGFYPSVVAAVPTITEVSRAAFFAGKALPDGKPPPTSADVKRFRDHRALGKFFEGGAAPVLLLRAEGHTKGGAATEQAHTLVGDPEARVVGIVINAIDASLKGDSQQVQRWDVKAIRSLHDLLEKARDAGRSVLLASDHGHVPSDRFESMPRPAEGGSRWRWWRGADDSLADGEQLYRGTHVWRPKGAEGVVLLNDDTRRYGGSTHAGEHGGATLAEAITPCVLIGATSNAFVTEKGDAPTRVMGAHVPSWWLFDIPEPIRPSSPPPPLPKTERKDKKRRGGKVVPENQLALAGMLPVAAPEEATSPKRKSNEGAAAPTRVRELAESAEFKARAKGADAAKVLRAVDFLLARNGVVAADAFAAALGELTFRVGGLVSTMQGVLHIDGYTVLRFDRQNGQIYLDRDKLNELFEVNL